MRLVCFHAAKVVLLYDMSKSMRTFCHIFSDEHWGGRQRIVSFGYERYIGDKGSALPLFTNMHCTFIVRKMAVDYLFYSVHLGTQYFLTPVCPVSVPFTGQTGVRK